MSRTRTLLTTVALVVGVIARSTSARSQCVNPPFAPNWLQQQKAPNVAAAPGPAHGGHTIATHVSITDQGLIDRVTYANVNADGTYPNLAAAQATITAALANDAARANNWRAGVGVGATHRVNYAAPNNIGRIAFPVGNPPTAVAVADTCAFAVVLRALPDGARYVVTLFPRPATPADNCH